jgi:hypothetical protein
MPQYLLHHRHAPAECGTAFASFKGETSPLRQNRAIASCHSGGHEIWWLIQADSPPQALALLPRYVAERTEVIPIRKVRIP